MRIHDRRHRREQPSGEASRIWLIPRRLLAASNCRVPDNRDEITPDAFAPRGAPLPFGPRPPCRVDVGTVHLAMMRKCACIQNAHMDPIWSLQSEVMKILASPRRLEILHLLAEEPKEVGRLAEEMGITQPNVSQHLAVMRSAGIVEAQREGREVRYHLTDPEVIDACNLMRGVLMRRLARLGELSDRPNPSDERPMPAASPAGAG
jgi:DNA-binding transcriptional ArsR family regulator